MNPSHKSDLLSLPLITAKSRAQAQEDAAKAAYNKAEADQSTEIAAVMAKHAPVIAEKKQHFDKCAAINSELGVRGCACGCCDDYVQAKVEEVCRGLQRKPLEQYTQEDIQVALLRGGIEFDMDMMAQNDVKGELLAQITTETEMKEIVGISKIGDCSRALQMTASVAAGKGLPPPVDIEKDGSEDAPSTWSVKQTVGFITRNGALGDVGGLLMEQKIAGDVIGSMDLGYVTMLLTLTPFQRLAFKKEVVAMRKLIENEMKDAVAAKQPGLCW
jgi:hypothetical protein